MTSRLIEETALAIRAHAAWKAAHHLDADERELLLSYVIWPGPALAQASRERARAELVMLRGKAS